MREKMVMDRETRELIHRNSLNVNLEPVKKAARRKFRRKANNELKLSMAKGDLDQSGPELGHRLRGGTYF